MLLTVVNVTDVQLYNNFIISLFMDNLISNIRTSCADICKYGNINYELYCVKPFSLRSIFVIA